MRLPLLVAAISATTAPSALSQTIVGDGQDLQAAIDAAASGDVIEIQSDGTFGGIRIANKDLTVRAGDGFSPIISGPGDFTPLAAVLGSGAPGDTSVIQLEGLTFVGAQTVVALENAAPGSTQSLTVTFESCNLSGAFASFEAPDRTLDLTFSNSLVRPMSPLLPTAAGSTIQLLNSIILGEIDASCGGAIRLEDSDLRDSLVVEGVDGLTTDIDIHRTSITGGVELRSNVGGPIEALVESSLLEFDVDPGAGAALNVRQAGASASLRAVNCTVRGYTFGLGVLGGALVEVENVLFDGNGTDLLLVSSDPTSIFRNSIIPDGSFDGVDGNTSSLATFGCGSELVAGTNGVDAGDSLVADLGATDLLGNPRVQDSNGDGTPEVNIGAIETLADFGAQATLFNGAGTNPEDLAALTAPAIGTSFDLSITTLPDTTATVAQIDLPSPVPFPNPVGTGEVFLQLSGAAIGDFQVPGGSHSFPIPPNLGLLGSNLRVQGFRVAIFPALQVDALNAFDLDFGTPCP